MAWPPDVVETADAVRRGERRAAEVLDEAMARIDDGNDRLNAFVHLDPDLARAAADRVDRMVAAGDDPGPLAGVPFGVKDLEHCAGMPTSLGSLVFKGGPAATHDSLLVERLRAAGAVPVGKTAASELGLDSVTSTPAWGTTRNPWNLECTPGGSSGGSAAAVSAGMVPFCTGSDGGGSIRSPAAFCGLVGLKVSHGRVPRTPSSDTSVPGVLATTVAATARLLDVTAGHDPRDRTSLPTPDHRYETLAETLDVRGLRAAWSPDLGYAPVDRDVVEVAYQGARRLCEEAGLVLVDRAFAPPNPYEAWALAACFAVRGELELDGAWPDRLDELSPIVRGAARFGDRATARDVAHAGRVRAEIEQATADLFADVDLLLTPATALAAFAAEGPIPRQIDGRDASNSGAEPFTMLANLCWNPAIAVPAGVSPDGLPIGMQVMARRFRDDQLLRLARIMERAAPWPRVAPGW